MLGRIGILVIFLRCRTESIFMYRLVYKLFRINSYFCKAGCYLKFVFRVRIYSVLAGC